MVKRLRRPLEDDASLGVVQRRRPYALPLDYHGDKQQRYLERECVGQELPRALRVEGTHVVFGASDDDGHGKTAMTAVRS